MKILVSGSTTSVRSAIDDRPDRIGVLTTPADGNREWWGPTVSWAADNGCFGGLDAPGYLRFVAKILAWKTRPMWVTAPDVVGDANETLRLFGRWQPMLSDVGLPVSLVLQDGMTVSRLKYQMPLLDAVFVGGTTAWKLGDEAIELCRVANREGKRVHVGRVNTMGRIYYFARRARDAGFAIDSIDGSGFSRFGDDKIKRGVRWVDAAMKCRQQVMFGGTA